MSCELWVMSRESWVVSQYLFYHTVPKQSGEVTDVNSSNHEILRFTNNGRFPGLSPWSRALGRRVSWSAFWSNRLKIVLIMRFFAALRMTIQNYPPSLLFPFPLFISPFPFALSLCPFPISLFLFPISYWLFPIDFFLLTIDFFLLT